MTNAVSDNAKLKAGTYYLKITSNETLSSAPTISINAEGTNNDVTNAGSVLISGNAYKYTRTIATDASAVGSVIEDISISGQDAQGNNATNVNPTNETTKAIYTDTKAPTIASDVFVDPNSTTYWNQGNKTVNWTTTKITDEGGLSANSLTFNYYDGSTWNGLASDEANDGSLIWNVPNLNITNAKLRVAATDEAGNSSPFTESDQFVIDNTPPSVNTITFTQNNNPGNGNEINASTTSMTITITYDEDMLQSVAPNVTFANPDLTTSILTLNNGLSGWTSATTYKAVYNVTDGNIDDNSVDLNITGAQDLATNVQNASNNVGLIQVDQVEPNFTPVTIASNNTYMDLAKSGNTVTVSLTSNETLQGITVNSMQSGGVAVNNSVSTSNPSGNNWTAYYTVNSADNDGLVSFNITSTDLAGNTTVVNNTTDASSVTVDNTPPAGFTVGTVTSVGGTVVSGYWNSTNTSLNITVPIANDASLLNGTVQIIASDDNWSSQHNLGSSETIPTINTNQTVNISAATFEGLTGFGEGDVWKFKAIITDKAGNQTTGNESANTITVDQTVPTITPVTIASNNGTNTAYAKGGDVVTISITSDETLSGISVTNFTSGGNSVVNTPSTSGAGTNWSVTYNVSGSDPDGLIAFSVDNIDVAGNKTTVTATTNSSSVRIDNTLPVVSISSPSAGTRVNNNTITFSITETNTNQTTGSADGSTFVTFTSGNMANQLGGFAGVTDGSAFTATIKHIDQAGNQGTATLNLVKDVTIPSVTAITTSTSDGCYNQGDVIDFSVTFNEAVYVTGTPRLKLNTSPTAYATYQSGSGTNTWTYNYTVGTEEIADLDVIAIDLNSGTMKDEALNAIVDATDLTSINFDGSHAIVIDNTDPAVTSRTPNDNETGVAVNQTLTITFDENISLVNGKGITIFYNNSYANVFASYTIPSANVSVVGGNTLQIDPSSNFNCGVTYNVIVDNGAVIDCAGNEFAGYQLLSDWNFSTTSAPAVKNISPASSPYCEGDNITVNIANSESGINYQLYKDAVYTGVNATSSGENPLQLNYNNADAGTYTVIGVNGLCETTMNGSVTVGAYPTVSFSANDTEICAGETVTFTAGGGASYDFYVNTSLQQSGASNIYQSSTLNNNDEVWVIVTSSNGCSTNSSTITMTVNSLPTAGITSSDLDNTICSGDVVTFTASGGNTYEFYKNGVSVQGPGASNTYTTSSLANGDQVYVKAISTAGCIDYSSTITTTVNPTPTAGLTSSDVDNTICYGDNVTFTASGGTNYEFFINTTSVQNGASNSYSTTTLQNNDAVWVKVTNANGCYDYSSTFTHTVYNVPNATLNADDNSVCQGTTVTFTASPSGMTNYTFKVNGGTVQTGGSNIYSSNTLNNGDQVTVVVTNSNGCSDESSAITMTVYSYPNASLSSSDLDNVICAGNSVTFTATPSGMTNYSFYLNGSLVQSSASDKWTTTTLSNNDYVYAIVSNNGCTDASNTITMTVNTVPSQPGTISGSTTVHKGDNGVPYSVNAVAGATSYEWSYTGSNVTINNGSSNSITIDFSSSATSGALRVRAINDCGNSAWSSDLNITVEDALSAPVINGDPSNVSACQGGSAQFSVSSVSGNPTPTIKWQISTDDINYSDLYIDGVIYTTSNGGLTLNISNVNGLNGNYYRLFATNSQGTDASAGGLLTVNAPVTPSVTISTPNTTVCSGDNVTFTATPTNGGATPTYQWKLNGNYVGTNQNTYTTSSLNDGDKVWVVMTTSLTCVTTTTANSNTLTMTVETAPSYSVHPASQTVPSGTSVTFTATVNGTSPTYQWQESTNSGINWNNITDGGLYSGATTTTLVLNGVPTGYNGYQYKLLSSNNCASNVASNVATLTVNPGPEKLVITSAIPSPATSGSQFTITVQSQDNGGTPRNVGSNTPVHLTGTGTNFDYVEVVSSDTVIDAGTNQVSFDIKLHSTNSDKNGATNVYLTVDNNGGHELSSTTSSTFTLLSIEPTSQAYNINWTGIGNNYITFNWTKGNSIGTLVLAQQGVNTISDTPSDATNYTANSVYNSGQSIGSSYVVYNDTLAAVSVTGLTPLTKYCFRLFAVNGLTASTRNYRTDLGTNTQRYRTTPLKEGDLSNELINNSFITDLNITPNPAKSEINVVIDLMQNANLTISIHTLAGTEILRPIINEPFSAGHHTINIPLEHLNLASGSYIIIIGAGPEVIMDRFVIQK